jgi:tetratricopeptide (TPR) repeat protein
MKLEEMLRHLQADAHPQDPRIASVALRLGQEYDSSGESPDKVLRYGQQALQVLKTSSISDPLETAMCYHLIASAHNKLGHHDVSLANLKHALRIIEKHEGPEYGPVMFAVHFLLGDTFAALGKHDESLHHYSKGLSVQETFLEPGHPHLASSYRQVGEAFTQVMRFDDAKTLAKKALESHLKIPGEGSIEEAIDRRLLSVIYSGLEDHEKALEEQLLVRKILKERNIGSETVFVEISTADTQITLGKFDDAIASLQSALSQMAEDSPMRSLATVNLAKAYAGLGKMEQARSYCSMAMDIVNNRSKGLAAKDPHALAVAEAFTELSAIYEQLNQPEEAIGLLKRALTVFAEIPEQKNAAAGTQAQVGLLLINNGQLEAALPHLEDAVEKLRQSFGDNHFSLGLVLNHLGVAHLELGHPVKALKILEEAKKILSKAYGPSNSDTLGSYENLVNVYSKLGRYEEAIACARHIVSELKEQGNEDAFLEAQRKLQILEDQKARNAK